MYASQNQQLDQHQTQAILDLINHQLTADGYQQIQHKRLSLFTTQYPTHQIDHTQPKQNTLPNTPQLDLASIHFYQGLTKATNRQRICVMIKWQYQVAIHDTDSLECHASNLKHEIHALQHLQQQITNKQVNTGTNDKHNQSPVLLPLVITHIAINNSQLPAVRKTTNKHLTNILPKQGKLSYFTLPYCPLGNVREFLQHQANDCLYLPSYHTLILPVLLKTSQAIAKLHQLGWLHGDIKPSNVLVQSFTLVQKPVQSEQPPISHLADTTQALELKLIDMGLAQPIAISSTGYDYDNDDNDNDANTHSANSVTPHTLACANIKTHTTPKYLAPECWQGHPKSIQTDVFAFGMMMLEVLLLHAITNAPTSTTHKPSYQLNPRCADTILATIKTLPEQHTVYQPILKRLLASKPQNRYQSMQAVTETLRNLLDQQI